MRQTLFRAVLAACALCAAALAAPALAQQNESEPPLRVLPVFPQADGPGAPERPDAMWLSPDRDGAPVAAAAAGDDGVWRMTIAEDGDYWLIVEGGPKTRVFLRLQVGDAAMDMMLPPCEAPCAPRVGPARFTLRAGDEVEAQIADGVIVTGSRLQKRRYWWEQPRNGPLWPMDRPREGEPG